MGWYDTHILPRLLDWQLSRPPFPEQRRVVQSSLSGVVLEIGFGSGLSLPHFPSGSDGVTRLLALDPSPGMLRRAQSRIAAAPFAVEILPFHPDRPYPVADGSVDWVLSELTLCTVPDVAVVLAEVRRVLRPGGRFRFFEHGAAEEPGWLRWQQRLTPVQRYIGGGCCLDRPIDALVWGAGFSSVDVERVRLPHIPKLLGRLYVGTASV
jgi:SAM-dependent methyltransferase